MSVPTLDEWRARGQQMLVGRHQVFYIDTGGDKPPLLLLHGYPTSSYDFQRALPALAARYRVIVHDHLGFGLSDKPREYSYSLMEQADIALELWRALAVETADIVAHDYGTSVATELLARRERGLLPIEMRSLTLSNGSVHIELAKLRVIQRLLRQPTIGPMVARFGNYPLFRRNIRNLFADRSFLPEAELQVMWQGLIANGGRTTLAHVSRYLDERHRYWHRWIGALRTTDAPINVVWATEDPVAVLAIGRAIHEESRRSRLRLLPGVGHFPMIEAADTWTDAVLTSIDQSRA